MPQTELPTASAVQQTAGLQTTQQKALQQPSSVFNEKDHCIFRLGKMIRGPSRQVMLEIYQRATRIIPTKMNLLVYLESQKQFSRTLLKSQFNTSQREKLLASNSGNDYDITLLHLSITLMRAHVTDTNKLAHQYDELENRLRAVKDIRNYIMHDADSISESELVDLTESLRGHLCKALEEARIVYGMDLGTVNQLIQEMNDKLNSIRDNPLEDLDITTYQSQRLFLQLQKLLSDSGKEELKKIYDKWSYLNPVSFIDGSDLFLEVGIVFTRMEIIEDGILHNINRQIEYERILEHVHSTVDRNVSNEVEIVLLEGPAGAGKTTLTKLMMHYWMFGKKNMKGLTDYDIFLYTECRNPNISSLSELLKSLMPETVKKFRNEDDVLKCIEEFRLLVVIDGLDELNASSTKLFKEILNIRRTCCVTIVCTARPEMVSDFYKMTPDDLRPVHMKVLGIPDNRRTEFAANYHDEMINKGRSQQNTTELIDYLEKCPGHFQEHFRLPLNLVLLTVLWALAPDSVNKVSTATEMYVEILKLIKERLLERLKCNEHSQFLSIEEMKRKIEVFFSSMCRNALVSLGDDAIILTEEVAMKLKEVCSSVSLPPEEVTSAFLVQKNTLTTLGIQSYLSFPHKGLQDFYSALFVLNTLLKKYKCQNLDVPNIIEDFQGILERHRIHSSIWPDIIIPIRNTLEPQVTIFSILKEFHKDTSSLTFSKYQNVLIHLAGLVHLDGRTVHHSTALELVNLLKNSGMVNREQWLGLLTEVKCDPAVTKYIAQYVPHMVKGKIEVKDSNVAAYASLLLHAQPESVSVDITENPASIPRIEDMIKALAQLECKMNIFIEHDFKYLKSCNTSFDKALQLVLSRCNVEEFMGYLSRATALPSTLKELHLIILSDDHARQLLPDLKTSLPDLPQLNILRIHVPAREVQPTVLEPLPEVQHVRLYLTQVEESTVSQACQVAEALQPPNGFHTIDTSECDLTPDVGMKLEHLLDQAGVKTEEYVPFSYCQKASGIQVMSEFRITDREVKDYSSWLGLAKPTKVHLDIRKDPDDLPLLPLLLKNISLMDCNVVLRLNHHYRHPNEHKTSNDLLLCLLHAGTNCKLEEFRGHLSEGGVTLLPSTLKEVHLAVVSNSHAQQLVPKLRAILPQLPNLMVLGVHVVPRVFLEELEPLPSVKYVRLYLTKVGDDNVGRVCDVAKALKPLGGYSSIRFPDATAKRSGWEELILSLHQKQVAVRGGIGVPDTSVITSNEVHLDTLAEGKLNCGFWSWTKEYLWR